jgi:hypothetical protein
MSMTTLNCPRAIKFRAYEVKDDTIKEIRCDMAAQIRENRAQIRCMTETIRVSINDLPPLSAAEASHELEGRALGRY